MQFAQGVQRNSLSWTWMLCTILCAHMLALFKYDDISLCGVNELERSTTNEVKKKAHRLCDNRANRNTS